MSSGTTVLHDSSRISEGWFFIDKLTRTWVGSDDPVRHSAMNDYSCVKQYTRSVALRDQTGGILNAFAPNFFIGGQETMYDNSQQDLILSLHDSYRGSDFNGDQFLGESKDAFELIHERSKNVKGFVQNFMRQPNVKGIIRNLVRNRLAPQKGAAAKAKFASQLWLEAQYGWKPLVDDISSGVSAISSTFEPPPRQITGKVRRSVVVSRRDGPLHEIGKAVYKSRIVLGVAPSTPKPLAEHFGFSEFPSEFSLDTFGEFAGDSLNDAAEVLWNLLPFSFVFDWFIPVGDYFSALSAFKDSEHWTPGYGTASTRLSCVVEKCDPPYTCESGLTSDVRSFGRFAVDHLTLPPPVPKPLKKALSIAHVANAIALGFGMSIR